LSHNIFLLLSHYFFEMIPPKNLVSHDVPPNAKCPLTAPAGNRHTFRSIYPTICGLFLHRYFEYIRYRGFIQLIIQSIPFLFPLPELFGSPFALALTENTVFPGTKYTISCIYFFPQFIHFITEIIV